MKLIDNTIGVNTNDLKIFLALLSAYGDSIKNPYVVDASQTLLDHLFGEEELKSKFEKWSKGQIRFKDSVPQEVESSYTTEDGE